ncbi:MAG: serine hydrolase domain-containing protein [Armatimonadota bacterium]
MKTYGLLNGYDSFVQRCMRDWNVPGMAIGIVRGQHIIHAKGYGYRDLDARLPFTENTVFCIDSCTKAFVAAAIGILVDDGVVDIDKPIREYIPSFEMMDKFVSERATLRDFLAHRSGIPNSGHAWMSLGSTASISELVSRLKYLEVNADFRSIWQYNSYNYLILSHAIECVSGIPWHQFVRNRILLPLGMTSSGFEFEANALGNDYVIGYTRHGQKFISARQTWGDLYDRFRNLPSSGSIMSTATDMCRWLQLMLLTGTARTRQYPGGAPISEPALATLHSPQIPAPNFFNGEEFLDSMYAMGWFCQPYRGKRLLFHGGAGIDGLTIVSFMPDEKIGVVVTSNTREFLFNAINAVTLRAYDCLLGLKPIQFNSRWKKQAALNVSPPTDAPVAKERMVKSTIPLKELAGVYKNPGYGEIELKLSRGNLYIHYNSLMYKLQCKAENIFKSSLSGTTPVELSDWWGVREVSFSQDKVTNEWSISVPFEPSVSPIVFSRALGCLNDKTE